VAVANRVGDKFAAVNATISGMTVAALRGAAPDPGTMLETITVARDEGALEEAFRALINFLWSATGYLNVDEIERTAELAQSRLAGLPSSLWVNAYLDISLVAQHLIPAGRWEKATEIIERWDGEELTATNRVPWLGARTARMPTWRSRDRWCARARAARARPEDPRATASHSDGECGPALGRTRGSGGGAAGGGGSDSRAHRPPLVRGDIGPARHPCDRCRRRARTASPLDGFPRPRHPTPPTPPR